MSFDAAIYALPKIDCHCHILDPARFAYGADVPYRPAGQETGSADYFAQVLDAYSARHALLVEPNSGYGPDNRCMLDAIARGKGRFKGIAVVANDAPLGELQALQAQGVVGVAFNVSLYGLSHYANIAPLLSRLAQLGLFANVQVQDDQLATLAPLLRDASVQVLVDHCGRPDASRGLDAPGFAALLAMAQNGRTTVKISGFSKFSKEGFPFADTRGHVAALLQAFGPDYGPLLQLFAASVPDATWRRKILWDTPMRLFGFAAAP
jgi:predicted TIM-barrel fold metal-dependent hydrolase